MDGVNYTLYLHPLPVQTSAEQLCHGCLDGIAGNLCLANDPHLPATDNGSVVPGAGHPYYIHDCAGLHGKDRTGGNCDENAPCGVAHKQCGVPGIDERIVIGDDSSKMNRISACRLFGSETMRFPCGNQSPQRPLRIPRALSSGCSTGQNQGEARPGSERRSHCMPPLEEASPNPVRRERNTPTLPAGASTLAPLFILSSVGQRSHANICNLQGIANLAYAEKPVWRIIFAGR